jgi:hypothetical protein
MNKAPYSEELKKIIEDITLTSALLYAVGWRKEDKEGMRILFSFTEDQADFVCTVLEYLEEKEKENRINTKKAG